MDVRAMLAQLAADPQKVEQLADELASKGIMPPPLHQVDQTKKMLQARKMAMQQQAMMGAATPPTPQMPQAVPTGTPPSVTPVSPQQPQAANQQLGLVKGNNPYLM